MTRRVPNRSLLFAFSFAFSFTLVSVSGAQEGPAGISVPAAGLGTGRMLAGYGVDLAVKEGVGQGELRRLWRVFPFAVRMGVSPNVDVIAAWRGGLVARSGDGEKHSDWGDPSVFAKITLTDSGSPLSAGAMFGFKVPSTRYLPHRLGSDAADLYFQAIAGRSFGGGEIRLNAGVAIIGDPRFAGSQDDMLTGSATFIVRPADGWEMFTGLYGFTGPREDDDKLQLRGGVGVGAGIGTVTVYGNARLAGSPVDFGTAFEGTGSWGIGASMTHHIAF
jgi:hypothetical protein